MRISDWISDVCSSDLVTTACRAQPVRRQSQGLFPLDFLELAAAPFADAQQGLAEPGRRVVLHDAGRALGTEHALVHRMVGIALQIADLAVLEVDVDAAAAGAHVARGLLDFAGNFRGGVDVLQSSLQWTPGHRSSLSAAPVEIGRAS